ncbi:hypothetical protein SBF1_2330019 [Candidatus Desulfosporosinus infrequens]|uniref:rRNA biogenesis protein rrp5 n=1 Tax=Candidatus Desulfosporosinus infrequens TaxID=2043169 RepID=A0A2U3KMA4_9FIRM|nr:hypothetical protein SBF1_2330019 [Candidatus Desulfosporosinus infrequens]
MNKLEITINKADELIAAMARLAAALENQKTSILDVPEVGVIEPEPEKEISIPAREETPITAEQIRAVLTTKNKAGKKDAIQELLKRYGTVNLTKLDPAKYAEFLKEAEEL